MNTAIPIEYSNVPGELVELISRTLFSQWLIWAACLAVGVVLGRVAAGLLRWMGKLEERGWNRRAVIFNGAAGPASLAILAYAFGVALHALPLEPRSNANFGLFYLQVKRFCLYAAALWYVINLSQIIEISLERMAGRSNSMLDHKVVPILRKTMRTALVLIGGLIILSQVFGVNIGAWLAGLGIAGLAISLAAQDSIKNLFGALSILLDRPFRIGDRIVVKGYDGVVEDIGFRAVRLRTGKNHYVTLPNSAIVSDPVENISARGFIQRTINLGLACHTTPAQMQQAVDLLNRILDEPGIAEPIHQRLGADDLPPRIHFTDFNSDNLNLQVNYWHLPPNYWDYMAHAHRVNLRILEEFTKAGLEFAYPTRTIHLVNDSPAPSSRI